MRKPVYAICEQQRRRSACASGQFDQHLCCSLPRKYNISSFYIRNCKLQTSFCGCAGRFESYLVENLEDRFSHDEAQLVVSLLHHHTLLYGRHIRLYYTAKKNVVFDWILRRQSPSRKCFLLLKAFTEMVAIKAIKKKKNLLQALLTKMR